MLSTAIQNDGEVHETDCGVNSFMLAVPLQIGVPSKAAETDTGKSPTATQNELEAQETDSGGKPRRPGPAHPPPM
jgi:hypothetical protein